MSFSTVFRLTARRIRTAIIMHTNPQVRLHTTFGTIELRVPDKGRQRRRMAVLFLVVGALSYLLVTVGSF